MAVHEVEFRLAPMVEMDLSCDLQMVLGYGPATAVQSLLQNNCSVDYPAAEPSSREESLSGALMNGVHVGHLEFRSTWSAGEHSYW